MEAYKNWVRKNKDYVHSIESLANSLTWLLPERFSDSEIGPEAVTAILGIITAINDHIIETTPTRNTSSAEPSSFPWSLCISALKDLETLVEVVAQHFYGDDKKWNFIAVTEAIKVLVRLALFRDSGYKMLLHGGEATNTVEDPNASGSHHRMQNFTKPGGHQGPGYFQDYNGYRAQNLEGRALSALSRFGENARMTLDPTWLSRLHYQHSPFVESSSPVAERPTLAKVLSDQGLSGGLFVLSEVLFITRPLIYVLFIRKYGVRFWLPWFISLAVDITGTGILSLVTSSWGSKNNQHYSLSTSEMNEVKRRKLLWALYLMRDPFFSKYTRQRLENAEKLLEPVPVIGLLTAKFIELIIGAQTRYTYMSGS
ncbi:PREDICTED: peroxisome biogenesis protein 16 [Nelumbo nucifera]|uniref:Peroxisomal membrane protein PEX16 n=1 Tax=Nelumbo nucifera TaxID=4432 RepID=A0A1U8A311_NELNU|nr:PREDICTED: peroxisome biogenesis protein 16 [Nelumbo nucifera]